MGDVKDRVGRGPGHAWVGDDDALPRRRAPLMRFAVVLALSVGVLPAAPGRAATERDIDLQRFKASPGAADLLAVPSPRTAAPGGWHFLVAAHWAERPLRLVRDDGTTVEALLGHQLGLDLGVAFAPWERLELGLVLPVTLHQAAGAGVGTLAAAPFGATGLGDLSLVPKLLLVRGERVRVGVALPLTLPTAMGDAFAGSGGLTVRPRLLAGASLGAVRTSAVAGIVLRPTRSYLNLEQGAALDLGLGAELPFEAAGGRWAALATLTGEVGLGASGEEERPVELLMGLRWRRPEGPAVTLAAGPGLTKGAGTPVFRALLLLGWTPFAPRPAARATAPAGPPVAAAAPEPSPPTPGPTATVDKARRRIRTLEQVFFAKDSDVLLESSYPVLRAVAASLRDHPEIRRLRVEGHTDAEGEAGYNLLLSQRRAASVVRFLVGEGVAPERLIAVGHGEGRPVDTNETAVGRARNRRVEFTIVETDR